jgi:hypothetical protein
LPQASRPRACGVAAKRLDVWENFVNQRYFAPQHAPPTQQSQQLSHTHTPVSQQPQSHVAQQQLAQLAGHAPPQQEPPAAAMVAGANRDAKSNTNRYMRNLLKNQF